MECEIEKITGTKCHYTPELILSYKGQELCLCEKHFDMVLPYADTKDDDNQSELEYQKDALIDILADWSTPYPGEPLDHWKLLLGKIDQLIEAAREEGKGLHDSSTHKVDYVKVALSPDVVKRLQEDNSWTLSAPGLLWQGALGNGVGYVESFKYETKLGPDGWVILRKIEGDDHDET